jgi:hypothetical protein
VDLTPGVYIVFVEAEVDAHQVSYEVGRVVVGEGFPEVEGRGILRDTTAI